VNFEWKLPKIELDEKDLILVLAQRHKLSQKQQQQKQELFKSTFGKTCYNNVETQFFLRPIDLISFFSNCDLVTLPSTKKFFS